MPIINVKISAKKSSTVTKDVTQLLLDLTTKILKKKSEIITILLDYVDHDDWLVGGKSLSELNKNSFYLEIKLTDETNTKDEKALYIKEVFNGFARVLGNLNNECYIHIHDVRAAAYGFGGLTQEYRFQH